MPPQVGVVQDEQRDGVEVEELPQLAHRRVEHLVEVERGGQRLGDLVQLVEQGVGVGQAAQAVEGQDLALVGLARDAAGVAGDEGDEQDLDRPLQRTVRASSSAKVGSSAHGRLTATIATAAIRRPKPNPRANPATATAVSIEKASGESQ